MNLSLFVSTSCLLGTQPIEARLSSYQECGLNAIELGAGVITNGNVSALLSRQGGRFIIHNYFPPPSDPFVLNLASPDEQTLQRSIGLVSEALKLSKQIGAPFYSMHAGFVRDPIGVGPDSLLFAVVPPSAEETQSAFHRFVNALEPLLDLAKNLGLRILIENNVCTTDNRGKLLLQTADEFLTLFRTLPNPSLGMLLDTGHLRVSAKTFGFDCFGFVDQIAPYVGALHIHDNDGVVDNHQPIGPGCWVLEAVRRPEFAELPLVLEAKFRTSSELREHVDWLSKELS